MTYIDSHAHLYFDRFDEDRSEVIERTRAAGFVQVINVGTDAETSRAAVSLAREHPEFCYAAVGLHPTSTALEPDALDKTLTEIEALVADHPEQVVAIGEIGFDFYWDTSPPDRQEVAFLRQIDMARRLHLPIIIHCREAWPETLAAIARHGEGTVGVFHCFGGTVAEAEQALALGWYVSFAGNVSYPKAQDLRDAAKVVPLDRLLLETDSPFLAPQAKRGQRNEPMFALHTAETLAEIHDIDVEKIGRHTTNNARRLFALPETT